MGNMNYSYMGFVNMDHAKCSFYAQLTYTTHMILTLLELAPPHAVTNGPPLVKRGYIGIIPGAPTF